jgi:hypothetical protein
MAASEALFYAVTVFAATIGSDVAFGQLLKRQYLAAPDEYRRNGSPTWWTWKPSRRAKAVDL